MPDIKIKNRQGEPIQYDNIDIVSIPLADGTGYQRYITETQFITTEPLSVTENGVYTADPNRAYTPITVEVPLPSGRLEIHDTNVQDVYDYAEAQVVDANLIPQNIVKNVPILGVVGTRETGGDVSVEGITITANGTYNAPSGKAYTPVMVNVPDPIQFTTGTIVPPAKTVTVNYTGEIVKFYVEDSEGEIVLTDVDTNPTNVVFSCADVPYSTLTCTVVYDTSATT